jgi:hypothetical protein
MKVYAETASRRIGQLLGDVLVGAWVTAWVLAGLTVRRLVDELAAPGEAVERAGGRVADGMRGAQDQVSRIPGIGGSLRAPLQRLGEAGQALAGAGASQQHVAHQLALWLGVLVALIPVVTVFAVWLPGRVRWIREASAASRLRRNAASTYLGLLAMRAVANRPLRELRRASADPVADLQRGDYQALAALELRALGLRALDPSRRRLAAR